MKKVIYFMFFAFALSTNVVFAENDNDKLNQNEMLPIQIEMIDADDEETKKMYINQFMMQNGKKFTTADIMIIKQQLESLTPEQIQLLATGDYLDPTVNVIVSVLVGSLGIDRFLIGQTGWGILKLLTGGALGVWTIVDWFQISGLTKEANMEKFNENLMLIK
ncbi:MAG: TM2 domain-containing protein [Bacteroidales bacterium]|nr:TM2 domain-containing protein [Bacteroidales bacterium]MBQ2398134.1 TM2 domain-containing protein [Bacteroidales bacterium]